VSTAADDNDSSVDTARRLVQRRARAVARGASSAMSFYIDHAHGAILVGNDGRRVIDFGSGIAVNSIGHTAAPVVDAIREQVGKFIHTCFMVTPYEAYVEVCEQLNALITVDGERRTALFSTGAEAIENAVKIARVATGRPAIAVLDQAYHGRTNLTMAMTASNMPYKQGFGPFAPEVYRLPVAHPFRWPSGPERCADEAADLAIEQIETQIGPRNLAAVIVEPIQGEGGFIVPAPGFLRRIADYARSHDILFVADEIQTGLCRTGTWFAYEHEGLLPDLVVTAKGLAGGMPLSAVTGRAEVMDSVHEGGLGGTYSGNPVACASALATLALMRDEQLAKRALWIETVIRPALDEIATAYPAVGEVRGRGAMLAMEIVRSDDGRTPDPQTTSALQRACLERGLVVLTCGTHKNVLRLLPPLTIPHDVVLDGLRMLAEAFDHVAVKAA
jgi:4-aminobutyrate aminotransferase / (S)-3-amino-2-methylpropionate transaminase / 5-aminovalerate transaminase